MSEDILTVVRAFCQLHADWDKFFHDMTEKQVSMMFHSWPNRKAYIQALDTLLDTFHIELTPSTSPQNVVDFSITNFAEFEQLHVSLKQLSTFSSAQRLRETLSKSTLLRTAIFCSQLSLFDISELLFQYYIGLYPTDINALINYANAQFNMGKSIQNILTVIDKALENDPLNPYALKIKAAILVRQNALPKARELYLLVIETTPTFVDVWYELAQICFSLGQKRDAEDYLRQGIAHYPESSLLWRYLGYISSFDRKNDHVVIEALNKCLMLDPRDNEARQILGDYYLLLKKYQAAESMFLDAVKLDSQSIIAWISLGIAIINQNRFHEAESPFQKVIALNPHDITALTYLAIIYSNFEQLVAAKERIQAALIQNPNHPYAQKTNKIIEAQLQKQLLAQQRLQSQSKRE